MNFKALHEHTEPLIIANVWDARSAQIAENHGFKIIESSSAAMSNLLGYADGNNMNFSELYYLVERIKSVCELPLIVDIESGYSQSPQVIAEHIKNSSIRQSTKYQK